MNAATTLLAALLASSPQLMDGVPGQSVRYVSHVGTYDSQIWFRWEFGSGEHYDVMYFDQTDRRMLRYYATVTPDEVVTFPESIAFGPSDPAELEAGEGTTPVVIDRRDGAHCEGEVSYRWTAQRSGRRILLTQVQAIEITEGPCVPPESYFEMHAIDERGLEASIGPQWALRTEEP